MHVVSCDHPKQDIKIPVNNTSTVYLIHSCLDLEVTLESESGAGKAKLAALSAKSLTVFQTGTLDELEVFSDASLTTVDMQNLTSQNLTIVSPGNDVTVSNGNWSDKADISVENVENLWLKNSRISCDRNKIDYFEFPTSDCVLKVTGINDVTIESSVFKSVVFDTSSVKHLNVDK